MVQFLASRGFLSSAHLVLKKLMFNISRNYILITSSGELLYNRSCWEAFPSTLIICPRFSLPKGMCIYIYTHIFVYIYIYTFH